MRTKQWVYATRVGTLALLSSVVDGSAHAQGVVVTPVVHQSYAHDRQAFTQGLVYWRGDLYESTGLYGRSSLRLVDIATGAVERRIELVSSEFAEGLALVDDRLVQLTWKEGVANVYALDSFQQLATFSYSGEGWGLCFDGNKLVMSDGSSSLFFRNPETFELESSLSVERNGQLVRELNELECVNGFVYANVWQRDEIVKIDAQSGLVVATIRVRDLLTSAEKAGTDVLNGIAFNPDTKRFFITGKLWPKVFEVEFPAEADPFYTGVATTEASNTISDSGASTTSTKDTKTDTKTQGGANNNASTLPAPARVANGCRCAVGRERGASIALEGLVALVLGLGFVRRRPRML